MIRDCASVGAAPVDTGVWVAHLQRGNNELPGLLNCAQVLSHPYVASAGEMLGFITTHALHGIGIGYVDAHLPASARLTPGSTLWTLDKRLAAAALRLGVAASVLG